MEMEKDCLDAEKIRNHFIETLRSRRSAQVKLSVEDGKPVMEPMYQESALPNSHSEVLQFCPKVQIENFKELLIEENLYVITEAGEQGRLPLLILRMKDSKERKPAVIFLHGVNHCKEWFRPMLEAYASRGYVAIAADSRYHGERATNKHTYRDALISSWKNGDTMPFIFDMVWDLIKLADYLTQREDIDPTKIGITGMSLGGVISWFAGAADTRYAVAVPIVGVQGVRWTIDNDKWQAGMDPMRPVFEEARKDLGKSTIDREVVEKVWDRIAPGLTSTFDAPYTIPAIAPRPLLIVNGAEDPYCPIESLEIPVSRAQKAYEEAQSQDKFKLIAEPGIQHQVTPFMVREVSDWFDKFLKK